MLTITERISLLMRYNYFPNNYLRNYDLNFIDLYTCNSAISYLHFTINRTFIDESYYCIELIHLFSSYTFFSITNKINLIYITPIRYAISGFSQVLVLNKFSTYELVLLNPYYDIFKYL